MSTGGWSQAAAVAAGAATGGLLRWQVGAWLNRPQAWLPAGTLLVNCAGGLLIGLAMALLSRAPDDLWRLLLVTGFLGGFTTFSAFSAESLALLLKGQPGAALLHATAHLGGALACTAAGWSIGRWWRVAGAAA